MRLMLASVALLLAMTACTSDGDSPPASDPASDPPSDLPSSSASSPVAASPLPDPVHWFSNGASCNELRGPMLMSDEVRFSRPVTVSGMTAVGLTHGIHIGRITISPVPKGKIPIGGGWRGHRPAAKWRDDLAWDDRQPITGARLDAGKYYFFIPIDITDVPARYDGFELSWSDGSVDGTSTWHSRDVYRETCGS